MASTDPNRHRIDILKDVYLATIFLTRLRAPAWPEAAARPLASASWAFPIAGVAVGVVGGGAYALADVIGCPPLMSALFAIAAMAITTGGLHEDGLSDYADGIWGGATRDDRLAIMSDSRAGTYGVIALILAIGIRAVAIAAIGQPVAVLGALIAAGAVSRTMMTLMMAFMDPAKPSGLGADAGRPYFLVWSLATVLGLVILIAAAPGGWLWCAVAAIAGAAAVGGFAARTLGGQTGDVLGAGQQVSEALALAIIAAVLTQSG